MRPPSHRPTPPRGTATSSSRRVGGRNATAVMDGVGYMQAGYCSLCTIGPQPVVSPFGHPTGARVCRRCIRDRMIGLMDQMAETLGLPRTGTPVSQPPLIPQVWLRRSDTDEDIGIARNVSFKEGLLVIDSPFIFGSIDDLQHIDVVVQDWETRWGSLGPGNRHRAVHAESKKPVLERRYRIEVPEDLSDELAVAYEIIQPS